MIGDIVRNYYSCGCYTSADVPILSRCEHHDGMVVSRTGGHLGSPRVFSKSPNVRLCNAEILDVMSRLKSPVDLAFCYVEPGLLSFTHMLTPLGFASARVEFFALLKLALSDSGQAVIIVDPEDLGAIYYQARLHKFTAHSRLVPVYFRPDPIRYGRMIAEKTYKVAIGLNTGPLPRFNFKTLLRLIDGLGIPNKSRILDTSCVFLSELEVARPNAKIIGIIEDGKRYSSQHRPKVQS